MQWTFSTTALPLETPHHAAVGSLFGVVLLVTVLPDGRVREFSIKKKSGNPYYDQFATKAFEAAMPLPAFPPQLKADHLVVELNFKPGSVM